MTTAERYSLLDHTADLGLEIYGRDLPELFANACFALFDNITDLSLLSGKSSKTITVTGDDTADLMINWLRELLGMWTVDGLLVKSSRMIDVSETKLTAKILFDPYAPGRHILKSDIKAVTYHDVQVRRQDSGWTARVVVDV
jgi:SHS2 domain-containing protein